MRKILALCLMTLLFTGGSIAQSPFEILPAGEICDGGTDYVTVPIKNDFAKGLLIRLNIFDTPADSLVDTVIVMLQTRFDVPNQSGMTSVVAPQAWVTFTDTLVTKKIDTTTAELWFPVDSLITGYDGTTLGNWLRFKFITSDSVSGTWCSDHGRGLKYQIVLGYF